jgi:hypothetical protein
LKLLCISNYDSNFNANGAKAIAILWSLYVAILILELIEYEGSSVSESLVTVMLAPI